MSKLAVFKYSIEIRDGEHEYGNNHYVLAPEGSEGLELVEKYARESLENYFGEGTHHDEEDIYWDETEERAARFDGCEQTWGGMFLPIVDRSNVLEVRFTIPTYWK